MAGLPPVFHDAQMVNLINGQMLHCHHVIANGESVCVVVMDGIEYHMPADGSVAADYNGTVDAPGPAVGKSLAVPAALAVDGVDESRPAAEKIVCQPSTSHMVLGCHALTLAAGQCALKNDFSKFRRYALENARSVTPLGAVMVDHITPRSRTEDPFGEDEASEPHRAFEMSHAGSRWLF
jgi:hypothetical protein